ncbi:SDR family oxidoreductase [Rhodococcus oxybenzonivorans]|jgi:3alpha(or 20beta)-hydroxysteroid dehydrogenase|uniref:SDR family oxidoreductase n=1 Tax=Rhodococcus TaxID=1827 RepID=UPI00202FDE68|nr:MULTISPECIES: SDR family oxidoreductase [Rhodococcus]MDV7353264.1 SDR family oxidoreductase [Rhodococcus oxybenzonivorans]
MRMQDKVALISGGARGMGASHARMIVAEGGNVVIGDILDDEGESLAKELGSDKAVYTRLDVTDYADWQNAVDLSVRTFGKLNVLVNNAGIVNMGSLTDYSIKEWDDIIAVNQTGPFLGIKAATPTLISSAPSSIINISSTAGFQGIAELHGYTASKFAVRGLTKSVALELAQHGVRSNSVHPGTVSTPMNADLDVADFNPMKRMGNVEEVSQLIIYLASNESSFVTGAEFLIDGGELAGMGPLSSK